jgi:RNA polymerase-binding transcription factor DksA
VAGAGSVKAVASESRRAEAQALRSELDRLRSRISALEAADGRGTESGLERGDPSITHLEVRRALLVQLRRRAGELEQALAGQDDAPRGMCIGCGNRIHPDRIAVLPDTRLCIRCARETQAQSGPRRRR